MSKEKDRMRELVQMFSRKDEIFVDKKESINEEALTAECNRLKSLGSGALNADFRENYAYGTDSEFSTGGAGATVNTIVDSALSNPAIGYKPIVQPLKTEEALDIAIKRTLESGAPVNNLSLYDEVNWNLSKLGFSSRNALDIKTRILSMISNDKEK